MLSIHKMNIFASVNCKSCTRFIDVILGVSEGFYVNKKRAQDSHPSLVIDVVLKNAYRIIPVGPGVRDHFIIHLIISGKGCFTVNGKIHANFWAIPCSV